MAVWIILSRTNFVVLADSFPVGNSEYVKQFLLQYSMLRSKEGFILRHDSLQVPMDLSSIAPEHVMGGMNAQMLNQPGTHCYSL
jgi:hypothetical protein